MRNIIRTKQIFLTILHLFLITINTTNSHEFSKPKGSLTSYISDLEHHHGQDYENYLDTLAIERKDLAELYLSTLKSGTDQQFRIVCRNFVLSSPESYTLARGCETLLGEENSKICIFLREHPIFIRSFMCTCIETNKDLDFIYLLTELNQQIDADDALEFLLSTLSRDQLDLADAIASQHWIRNNGFADQAAISCAYYGNLKLLKKISRTITLSKNAISCIYSIFMTKEQSDPSFLLEYIQNFRNQFRNSAHLEKAPTFNKICASKFLNMHNEILYYEGKFYRLFFRLSTSPFMLPYEVVYDDDEIMSRINLNQLFISKPYPALSNSFFYLALAKTESKNIKAHGCCYAEIMRINYPINFYIELRPVSLSQKNINSRIWELSADSQQFLILFNQNEF